MKHLFFRGLLSFLLCTVFCMSASAKDTYDFKVKNSDGVMIYYSIIKGYNQSGNTVKVSRKKDNYDHNTYIGDVTVPATIEYKGVTYKVVDIGGAFSYCKELTSVTLPDDIELLKNNAFSGCRKLKSIKIPSSVTYIGERAFFGCKSLSSIELPASLDSIGKEAFDDCSGLTSIVIPPSVKKISEGAFWFCTSLAKVEMDVDNIEFGNNVFAKCPYQDEYDRAMSPKRQAKLAQEKERKAALAAQKAEKAKLKRAQLKYNIISDDAVEVTFKNDNYAGDIIIPETVTIEGKTYTVKRIGANAFSYCEEINSVIMPSTIERIEKYAFKNCCNMCVVNLPASIRFISMQAFENCKSLTGIILPESLQEMGGAVFYGCDKLQTVEVMCKNLVRCGSEAFNKCPVNNVTWGDGVKQNIEMFAGTPYGDEILYARSVAQQQQQKAKQAAAYNTLISNLSKKYGANTVNNIIKIMKENKSPESFPIGTPLDLLIQLSKAVQGYNHRFGEPDRAYQDKFGTWKVYEIQSSWGSLYSADSWKGEWWLYFKNGKLNDKIYHNDGVGVFH